MKNNIKTIKLEDIILEGRARQVVKDAEFDNLKHSLITNGLINPLTVFEFGDKYKLVCGGRRYTALFDVYGPTYEVKVSILPELTTKQAKMLELDENLRRKNFKWFEEVQLKGDIWCTLVEENRKYTQKEFSHLLGQSEALTSLELSIYFDMRDHPELVLCPSLTQAGETIRKSKLAKLVEERNRRLAVPVGPAIKAPQEFEEELIQMAEKDLLTGKSNRLTGSAKIHKDALTLLHSLPSNSVDCCVTDPPFGIGIESKKSREQELYGKKYSDTEKEYKILIKNVILELHRTLKEGSHLYMFFSFHNYPFLTHTLIETGFDVYPHPIIWVKQPLTGSTQRPEHHPAMCYEPCLFAFNFGERKRLVKMGRPNVILEPVINPKDKTHPLEFPVNVYKNLMERSCMEGDLVIDPFCGTGNSVQAALELGLRIEASEQAEKYRVFAEQKAIGWKEIW